MDQYTTARLQSSALLTIDTQNDFCLVDAPVYIEGTLEIVPNMVRILESYRTSKQPIIHVVRLYLADGSNAELCRRQGIEAGIKIVAPGTPGAELVDALKPDTAIRLDAEGLLSGNFQQIGENEFVMYKPRWGSFYQTRLQEFLSEHEVDTLVFTGCNFPNCPRSSIYQASERDLRIVLIRDAMSKLYVQGEKEMYDIGIEIMSTRELLAQRSEN